MGEAQALMVWGLYRKRVLEVTVGQCFIDGWEAGIGIGRDIAGLLLMEGAHAIQE